MAGNSTFTPKESLTEAPTNLKEAIDWVLRVTGRDGKKLGSDECICVLAAAVTDLLQSVELEYHGYQGDVKNGAEGDKKGATQKEVTDHLNGLFSLVQGLGGTAVVRTYIDQLAQVLSALVGWSKIEKCWGSNGGDKCEKDGKIHHGLTGKGCKYLNEATQNTPCDKCECMKWDVKDPNNEGTPLGRKCQRCSDEKNKKPCGCSPGDCGGPSKECKCALDGKCCKCCCTGCNGCKTHAKCSCTTEESITLIRSMYREVSIESYMSSYSKNIDSKINGNISIWKNVATSSDRSKCAQILLGSVCLIWSGITYMYWTGKWARGSPYWNNHILDGTGLDDGTLSQWLQALGFPREMLNNSGPGNRLDAVIWDGFRDKFFLGFLEPKDSGSKDYDGNTARSPYGMNYAGFVHTAHRDSFNTDAATVFKNGTSTDQINETDQHKNGAVFKLYILSCAYFTGLQNKTPPKAENRTPKTIREILYWLSALPYSQAYKDMLTYAKNKLKDVTKKPGDNANDTPKLSFIQTGRTHPITVDEFNLFAHFQAVTQYCPLVLIGIQGGIHSTKGTDSTKEPPIHSLYANTEFHFTYPTVDIQAYNQVVHYIRGLFYQLYFLRKQCAVKVTSGGKWRECRYGKDVVSKGVISWMCLGCNPMEHDRKSRLEKVKEGLKTVLKGTSGDLPGALREVLEKIGGVVVQLGNAQEALEGKEKDAILGVKVALTEAKAELEKAKKGLEEAMKNGLDAKLTKAKQVLGELTNGGSGALHKLANGGGNGSLQQITSEPQKWKKEYSDAKNEVTKAINKVLEVLNALQKEVPGLKDKLNDHKKTFDDAIKAILEIVRANKCVHCKNHIMKCGKKPESKYCNTCHQPTTTGVPSPLQAFLEDRLPGFSCEVVRSDESAQPQYPLAASHLGHCGGSGQCCPLPMGFRGQFQKGSITDMTGQRLYGILYFFSNENMMQSCVYTLVRVTAELSATTPQVLGDVFGFFRGGIGRPEKKEGEKSGNDTCNHNEDPSKSENKDKYFCGWCASGLRDEVKKIEWIQTVMGGKDYRETVGTALIDIKGDKGEIVALKGSTQNNTTSLSTLTKDSEYLSPLTGELYTAVSATFGGTYLSWVLYLSDALEGGLQSLSEAFRNVECRGCRECDPNKCKKGSHGDKGSAQCQCSSIVSCTGVLPVLYRHGFGYGNPFNLEGYQQKDKDQGDYSITDRSDKSTKRCHEFLDSLQDVIKKEEVAQKGQDAKHPLTELLKQVGQLQYDIRLPWIFVLTVAWLVAVLYLAFGAIWPLDWTHMRSHWLRGGEHQWQCMWYKVMTGRKGVDLMEYFGRR